MEEINNLEESSYDELNINVNNLPNELLIKILRYLPHSDLQQIRLVCRPWYDITQLPEFMNKSKLIITDENMDIIYTCLMNDAELSSRLAYNTLELYDLEKSDSLELILKSLAPSIRKLRLFESSILLYRVIYECLPDLEELNICRLCLRKYYHKFPLKLDLSKFKSFKSLNIETCCTTKRILHILERGVARKRKDLCWTWDVGSDESLIQHLWKNATYLKQLEVKFCAVYLNNSREWMEVFPLLRQLESFKIFCDYSDEWIKAFVEHLPKETPLRSLSIRYIPLSDSLLQQIVHKWPDCLQNIELINCYGLTDVGLKELAILRHNLKSLNILDKNVSSLGLLEGLVTETNNILKTLILDNAKGFDPISMGVLAQRLPQLTYLSLKNCENSVNDSTLEQIFRHQRQLQHLKLDKCIRITDDGILGFGLHPASILNLKGLQTLSLIGCKNLSNRTLCGLKFIELRRLFLDDCESFTSKGIEGLVKNCPTLENLYISRCLRICDDGILHIAEGLRRLSYLNVNNCLQLKGKSIAHLVEICKCLKEISMCNIKSFVVREVQEKCLQLKPRIVNLYLNKNYYKLTKSVIKID